MMQPSPSLALRLGLGVALVLWGADNFITLYRLDYGPFAIVAGRSLWLALGTGQILAGLLTLGGYCIRLVSVLLTILATLTMVVPEAVILGSAPLLAFAFATLGGAVALFFTGTGAERLA